MRVLLYWRILSGLVLMLTATNALALSFSLRTSDGGTLYLQSSAAQLADSAFLIDTGSSLTILTRQTFHKLKQAQKVTQGDLVIAKLANGRQHTVRLYNVPILALSDDCQFNNVSVAVMNKQHNILGMEVLRRAAPIGIALAPATLTLNQCDSQPVTVVNNSMVEQPLAK